jgi:ComF family protein
MQAMLKEVQTLGSKVLDFILPFRCPVSGELVDHRGGLSPEIWSNLDFIPDSICQICGIPMPPAYDEIEIFDDIKCEQCADHPPSYDIARARLKYSETSRKLILKFKHGDQIHLVHSMLPFLTQAATPFLNESTLVLPVPLHPLRLLKRKYNQAAILGEAFAKKHNIPYQPDLLIRTKHTQPQTGNRVNRKTNVKDAFSINPRNKTSLAGQHIILVDDVFTTGSTVNACAKILKANGADKVFVLSVTRVHHE